MITNGILNSSKEPVARWECDDVDPEVVKITIGERLRFPYANSVVAPNRIMKSPMSEQVIKFQYSSIYFNDSFVNMNEWFR